MEYFLATEHWMAVYPGAHAGILVMSNVVNPPTDSELDASKKALETEIRSRFAGKTREDIEKLPAVQAYAKYYARFKKTYHVQLQLESIAFKGKSIPSVAALVEAMFMAEVKDILLTAGHDLDRLQLPVRIDVARGDETYMNLRGQPQGVKPGDMYMADGEGIISSILYGPDERTQIRPETKKALFAVYAPEGIGAEQVEAHLREIEKNVRVVAPDAIIERLQVFGREE